MLRVEPNPKPKPKPNPNPNPNPNPDLVDAHEARGVVWAEGWLAPSRHLLGGQLEEGVELGEPTRVAHEGAAAVDRLHLRRGVEEDPAQDEAEADVRVRQRVVQPEGRAPRASWLGLGLGLG